MKNKDMFEEMVAEVVCENAKEMLMPTPEERIDGLEKVAGVTTDMLTDTVVNVATLVRQQGELLQVVTKMSHLVDMNTRQIEQLLGLPKNVKLVVDPPSSGEALTPTP